MARIQVFEPAPSEAYELLDSGAGRKLERFGSRVLDRPDPQALWRPARPAEWGRADLVFVRESDRGGRWEGTGTRDPWTVGWGGAVFLLQPTPFKHVGLFPEQAANWSWMKRELERIGGRPRVLNLFGYTGAASVLAALAGASVTHVDASRTTLAWFRENLRRSGLQEDAVRVLREDALSFARREVRRGARYHGVLLDPPHHGRGPRGERWRFERDAAELLDCAGRLLAQKAFLVLSTYAIGFSPLSLLGLVSGLEGGEAETGELVLREASGRLLPAGFCVRWRR